MSTIKIVSDGTLTGTQVLDSEGNVIENVVAVHFLAIADDQDTPTVLLKVRGVPVELLVHEDKVIKVPPAEEVVGEPTDTKDDAVEE